MTTEEKEIRRFFEELKAHDQALVPDFETTYQAAAKSRADRLWYLRRAAAMALVVVSSFVVLWFVPKQKPGHLSEITISSWTSPMDHPSLYPDLSQQSISNWQSPTEFTGSAPVTDSYLSNWKSPTDFLLTTSVKQQ